MDALQYAKSNILWEVELGGLVVRGKDKACATERTYLLRVDAGKLLQVSARWCALRVADNWECPDVVREWLETGKESLRAAAYFAAYSAADSAARSAARSAAYSAADSAAYSAERSAAYSAADSAAYSAERSAAYSAVNSAAYYAAYSAEILAQREKLLQLVKEAFGKEKK